MFKPDIREESYEEKHPKWYMLKQKPPNHLWAQHFTLPESQRNPIYTKVFLQQLSLYKVYYSFLHISQIHGKTYQYFGIPNICGEISKQYLEKYGKKSKRKNMKQNKKYNVDWKENKSLSNTSSSQSDVIQEKYNKFNCIKNSWKHERSYNEVEMHNKREFVYKPYVSKSRQTKPGTPVEDSPGNMDKKLLDQFLIFGKDVDRNNAIRKQNPISSTSSSDKSQKTISPLDKNLIENSRNIVTYKKSSLKVKSNNVSIKKKTVQFSNVDIYYPEPKESGEDEIVNYETYMKKQNETSSVKKIGNIAQILINRNKTIPNAEGSSNISTFTVRAEVHNQDYIDHTVCENSDKATNTGNQGKLNLLTPRKRLSAICEVNESEESDDVEDFGEVSTQSVSDDDCQGIAKDSNDLYKKPSENIVDNRSSHKEQGDEEIRETALSVKEISSDLNNEGDVLYDTINMVQDNKNLSFVLSGEEHLGESDPRTTEVQGTENNIDSRLSDEENLTEAVSQNKYDNDNIDISSLSDESPIISSNTIKAVKLNDEVVHMMQMLFSKEKEFETDSRVENIDRNLPSEPLRLSTGNNSMHKMLDATDDIQSVVDSFNSSDDEIESSQQAEKPNDCTKLVSRLNLWRERISTDKSKEETAKDDIQSSTSQKDDVEVHTVENEVCSYDKKNVSNEFTQFQSKIVVTHDSESDSMSLSNDSMDMDKFEDITYVTRNDEEILKSPKETTEIVKVCTKEFSNEEKLCEEMQLDKETDIGSLDVKNLQDEVDKDKDNISIMSEDSTSRCDSSDDMWSTVGNNDNNVGYDKIISSFENSLIHSPTQEKQPDEIFKDVYFSNVRTIESCSTEVMDENNNNSQQILSITGKVSDINIAIENDKLLSESEVPEFNTLVDKNVISPGFATNMQRNVSSQRELHISSNSDSDGIHSSTESNSSIKNVITSFRSLSQHSKETQNIRSDSFNVLDDSKREVASKDMMIGKDENIVSKTKTVLNTEETNIMLISQSQSNTLERNNALSSEATLSRRTTDDDSTGIRMNKVSQPDGKVSSYVSEVNRSQSFVHKDQSQLTQKGLDEVSEDYHIIKNTEKTCTSNSTTRKDSESSSVDFMNDSLKETVLCSGSKNSDHSDSVRGITLNAVVTVKQLESSDELLESSQLVLYKPTEDKSVKNVQSSSACAGNDSEIHKESEILETHIGVATSLATKEQINDVPASSSSRLQYSNQSLRSLVENPDSELSVEKLLDDASEDELLQSPSCSVISKSQSSQQRTNANEISTARKQIVEHLLPGSTDQKNRTLSMINESIIDCDVGKPASKSKSNYRSSSISTNLPYKVSLMNESVIDSDKRYFIDERKAGDDQNDLLSVVLCNESKRNSPEKTVVQNEEDNVSISENRLSMKHNKRDKIFVKNVHDANVIINEARIDPNRTLDVLLEEDLSDLCDVYSHQLSSDNKLSDRSNNDTENFSGKKDNYSSTDSDKNLKKIKSDRVVLQESSVGKNINLGKRRSLESGSEDIRNSKVAKLFDEEKVLETSSKTRQFHKAHNISMFDDDLSNPENDKENSEKVSKYFAKTTELTSKKKLSKQQKIKSPNIKSCGTSTVMKMRFGDDSNSTRNHVRKDKLVLDNIKPRSLSQELMLMGSDSDDSDKITSPSKTALDRLQYLSNPNGPSSKSDLSDAQNFNYSDIDKELSDEFQLSDDVDIDPCKDLDLVSRNKDTNRFSKSPPKKLTENSYKNIFKLPSIHEPLINSTSPSTSDISGSLADKVDESCINADRNTDSALISTAHNTSSEPMIQLKENDKCLKWLKASHFAKYNTTVGDQIKSTENVSTSDRQSAISSKSFKQWSKAHTNVNVLPPTTVKKDKCLSTSKDRSETSQFRNTRDDLFKRYNLNILSQNSDLSKSDILCSSNIDLSNSDSSDVKMSPLADLAMLSSPVSTRFSGTINSDIDSLQDVISSPINQWAVYNMDSPPDIEPDNYYD